MNVNYMEMQKDASFLKNRLKDADYLHIKTSAGTDLMLGNKDRVFSSDVVLKKGKVNNLPVW